MFQSLINKINKNKILVINLFVFEYLLFLSHKYNMCNYLLDINTKNRDETVN